VANVPWAKEKSEDCPDPDPQDNGFIGMMMHGLVESLGLSGLPFANATIDFLASLQCCGETLAGFPNLYTGYVGGGCH